MILNYEIFFLGRYGENFQT